MEQEEEGRGAAWVQHRLRQAPGSVRHWFQRCRPHLAEVYPRILLIVHLSNHRSAQVW